jgi:hypothetical protein
MLLDQLFEDAEGDLRRSQMANRFIENLVSYINKLDKAGRGIDHLHKYVVSHDAPDGYPGLVSDDFGYSGGMLRGVLVCFRHNDFPETNGSAAPVEDGGDIRYVVQMDVKTDDLRTLMFSVSSTNGRTVLLHEIAHVIDYIRYKDKNGIKKREIVRVKKAAKDMTPDERMAHRQKEIEVYHNDPLERNAFFHNMAEPLLQRMRYLQNDSMALEFLDPIPRDFREYFNGTLKKKYGVVGQHWATVSEDGKRRIVSRLNSLFTLFWKSLDAREAAKAKYSEEKSTEVAA